MVQDAADKTGWITMPCPTPNQAAERQRPWTSLKSLQGLPGHGRHQAGTKLKPRCNLHLRADEDRLGLSAASLRHGFGVRFDSAV